MGTTLPHSLCRLMQELGPPVCLLHATVKPGLQIQTGYMVHGLMNSKGLGACQHHEFDWFPHRLDFR